jgi:hypothetical protein
MIYFYKQCALVGQDLILEANFRNDEAVKIKEIADAYDYRVLLIVLTGDINLLYQRFLDRMATRHPAHRSLNLDVSIDRFADYIGNIRNEDMLYPEHKIDITDLDEDEVVIVALNIIYQELGL